MKANLICRICITSIGLFGITRTVAGQEPLHFQKAIELSLARSNQVVLSQADEERTYQTYLEARNSYIPKASVGSDVGYAHGFPLSLEGSAPTLLNVTTQSSVWSLAQRDFVKAAKTEWIATKSEGSNQRTQVIRDAAITYIELNMWESRLPILQDELNVAKNLKTAVTARVQEGIDKEIELTKAELLEAQVRVHVAEAQGAVDLLRTRLSQLTGLPPAIRIAGDSIPALREDPMAGDTISRTTQASPSVEAAEQSARAKQLRAKSEHRAFFPSADFAAQYGLVNSSLTNFEQFFVPHSFQANNVTFGLVLRFPFLDRSQHARALAADAEALRARKEVEEIKNKAALDALKIQHSVEQLRAVRDVADLRYKVAENALEAVHVRIEAETASLRELQDAALDASERMLERIDANFEVQRAEVDLLRLSGNLESWALSSGR
jgi:outer membrane protein TolC